IFGQRIIPFDFGCRYSKPMLQNIYDFMINSFLLKKYKNSPDICRIKGFLYIYKAEAHCATPVSEKLNCLANLGYRKGTAKPHLEPELPFRGSQVTKI